MSQPYLGTYIKDNSVKSVNFGFPPGLIIRNLIFTFFLWIVLSVSIEFLT